MELACAFFGSFLPWAEVGFITVNGTDDDGVLTAIGSAVAAGFFFRFQRQTSPGVSVSPTAIVCAALTAVVYIYDLSDIASTASDGGGAGFGLTVTPGIGLYLGTAGSIAAVIALALSRRTPSS